MLFRSLAGAIEDEAPESELDAMVAEAITALMRQTGGRPPHRAILGCTHFPLVEPLFRRHLPPFTRLLPQPAVVADSLEDYLTRHPHYLAAAPVLSAAAETIPVGSRDVILLTTGEPENASRRARVFWSNVGAFRHAS